MANVVVHCDRCGHPIGIATEIDEPIEPAQVRTVMKQKLGTDEIECPTCRSALVIGSGRLHNDDALALRAAAVASTNQEVIGVGQQGRVWFAVGTPGGPRSTVWELNGDKHDVYIAARSLRYDYKISLHGSGCWRCAFTDKAHPLVPPQGDRATSKWKRPIEIAPGWTRAFSIIVPATEVVEARSPVMSPENVAWIASPCIDSAVHFTVLLSAPGAKGSDGRGFATAMGYGDETRVITAFDLDDGERVWLVYHVEPMIESHHAWLDQIRKTLQPSALEIARGTPDTDLRLFGFGDFPDGTRFFVDVAVPE
jgi:hypothetical protein